MRLLLSCLLAITTSGCTLWFTGDGDDVPEPCPLYDTAGGAALEYRNPETLTCEAFGGYPCDDRCGPCPGAADIAQPSWGICGSSCDQLDENACSTDPDCRVVKDANCTFGAQTCFTDYLGCFPVDMAMDETVACHTADAQQCSRSNQCTAYHSTAPCSSSEVQCERPFELCAPEGESPGSCLGQIACDALPPNCPSGSTPAIADGCYTGACIRLALCAPAS